MPAHSSAHSYPSAAVPFPSAAPHRLGRTLHLAAAIGGGPAEHGTAYFRDLARLAEGGGLDFVTLELGAADGDRPGALDALALLAGVAPATGRIGLVPAVPAAGADPFDVAMAVATLDWVSRGRAGWAPGIPGPPPVQRGRGRRPERPAAVWQAADAAAGAVTGMWRAGRRAPSGAPVTALDATESAARAVAARHADIAFVRAVRAGAAGRIRADLHRLAAEAGRDPDRLLVLAELSVDLGGGEVGAEPGAEIALLADPSGGVLFRGGPVDLAELIADWQRQGAVDGFHVRPVQPGRDLERFVNGTAALLQHRGLFRSFHPGATLREHLGLHRPARTSALSHGALS
ncbi:LLM class flavin-dependent oxidoreductase [Streptomyces sp. NBC_01198]|uniref:LLM class flavin-dependent oxidoreductase n=1 Tax=Streptomyces sp. NBC_01198 TaxID=2903769 RepID=UPI002E126426|nr:LLM class flavin-dependent oxidoreductase [Streptomyces sp. NBC_01198]